MSKKLSKAGNMKPYRTLFLVVVHTLFLLSATTILPAHGEGIEKDMGIPLYPGSKQIPHYVPLETDRDPQSFQNISLITPDNFKKVLSFYQEKLGKFSVPKSQTLTKSALWSESTPKGYRIVTLIETQEGTKITISKRVWQMVDKASHQKNY